MYEFIILTHQEKTFYVFFLRVFIKRTVS